jgi:hypothetical protein
MLPTPEKNPKTAYVDLTLSYLLFTRLLFGNILNCALPKKLENIFSTAFFSTVNFSSLGNTGPQQAMLHHLIQFVIRRRK